MKHAHTMGDRFKALIAYDPLAGLHHKKRRDGGRVNLASIIGEQAKAVDTKPTEGQKAAGNYKKGHVKVHGLDISIENPRGSWREGGPPDKRWRSKLNHHYGYIRKTEGGDGDHVDVYLGPHLKSPHVFVVDQHHLDGDKKFDEHKCFIGFGSKAQAREAYHRAFSDGRGKERIGHSETLTIPDFKLWLAHADTTKAIKSRKNYADGGSVSGDDADVNVIPAPPTSPNYEQANKDLQLNPQEQALYQQHLTNLSGPGGVDNPDGSRSTLYQSVQEHNGKYYNVPTVWNGKRETEQYTQPQSGQVFDVPNQTALQNIGKAGWDTFPSYATPDEADERYDKMHDYMEKDTAAYLQGQQRAEGGRVHMADGGSPNPFDAFDVPQASAVPQASSSANPFDAFDSPSMRHDVAPSAPSLPPEAADHGLSERQKLSPLGKAASPITSYPETYNRMMHEALDQASKGVQHILHPESAWDEAKGVGNATMGAAGYVASPISAGYRSLVGQPVEDVTGIPREYTEFAAQLATPGLGLPKTGGSAPIVAPPPVTPVEAASARLGVPISKAAVSESPTVQSAAGALKEVPFVGAPLVKSAKQTLTGLDNAAKDTAAAYGSADTVTAGEAAKSGLEDWITGKSGDIAKRVYGRVDNMIDPDFERPLHATADTVNDIMAKRANAKISGVSPAVAEVQDAITAPAMNYQGLKDLRSHVGSMTPQEMVARGINPAEAKRIYGSLTEDLRGHILESGGPDALTTFDKANGVYSQIVERRKALSKIIGVKADAPPERVMDRMLQLASSKGGADQSTLIQARRAIGPEKWNEVTSAAIDRMGRAAPGADFSGDRLVTAWNNMSDRGRKTLFNSTGKPELAQNVEDIMTLSKNYKQLAAMGNPSGTGRVNAIMSALGALGGAAMGTATIGLAAPITMLASTLGGRTVAKVLSDPVAARSAAQWAKAYTNAVKSGGSPASVAALVPASQRLFERISQQIPHIIVHPQGPMPAAASDEQQSAPRPVN